MAFREVSVVQVREALRRWLHGDGPLPRRPPVRQSRDRNPEQLGDVHSVKEFHHTYEAVEGGEISRRPG